MKAETVSEEIRNRHRKIYKEQGFKAWLSYFLQYYKLHIFLVTLGIILVISFIYSMASKKTMALQVAFVNGIPNVPNEEFMADYLDFAGLDAEKYDSYLDASFFIDLENTTPADQQNMDRFFMMSSAKGIDAAIVNEGYFETLAKDGYLLDLTTVFSKEELSSMKEQLFYFDSPNDTHEGELLVGIEVSDAARLKNTASFLDEKAYFCIISMSDNIENARKFFDYIYLDMDIDRE